MDILLLEHYLYKQESSTCHCRAGINLNFAIMFMGGGRVRQYEEIKNLKLELMFLRMIPDWPGTDCSLKIFRGGNRDA
jgi:hypothetical protein